MDIRVAIAGGLVRIGLEWAYRGALRGVRKEKRSNDHRERLLHPFREASRRRARGVPRIDEFIPYIETYESVESNHLEPQFREVLHPKYARVRMNVLQITSQGPGVLLHRAHGALQPI